MLPLAVDEAVRAAGYRGAPWSSLSLPEGFVVGADRFVRFVTSWATKADDIAGLIATASEA